MKNKNRGYLNLDVWHKAMELFKLVWETVNSEAKIDYKPALQADDTERTDKAGGLSQKRRKYRQCGGCEGRIAFGYWRANLGCMVWEVNSLGDPRCFLFEPISECANNKLQLPIALAKLEKLSVYGRYSKRIIEDATNRLKGGN